MTEENKPSIEIQNIVASFTLAPPPLDLEKIHHAFEKESIWDEATFNYGVVVLRVEKPKMSFLIYQTGKVVCTGAKTVEDAEQSADCLFNRLKNANFNIENKTEAKIQNIVATTNLNTEIDLERFLVNIWRAQGVRVKYEPEQFPGAIIKLPVAQGSKATILLFSTGKLVCVGLKDYKNVHTAIEFLISNL